MLMQTPGEPQSRIEDRDSGDEVVLDGGTLPLSAPRNPTGLWPVFFHTNLHSNLVEKTGNLAIIEPSIYTGNKTEGAPSFFDALIWKLLRVVG
jgi:hypothetical protein